MGRVLILTLALLCAGCSKPAVDAFYYPDRNDLTKVVVIPNVGSVEKCREVIRQKAVEYGDAGLNHGDYECAIGPTGKFVGTAQVYKRTVQ